MLPLILSALLSPSLQPPAVMVLLIWNRVEIVPVWLLFELNTYPPEDRKIHITCIKEKKNQNPPMPGCGKYSDHLVHEIYLLLPCQLPLMPWQPSHSSVITAASSGLAALISLSGSPPFPCGNTCSSFIYVPPFSWIPLAFANWGFHKLLGREVGEGWFGDG